LVLVLACIQSISFPSGTLFYFSVGLLSKIPIASEKGKGRHWLNPAVAAVLMLWLLVIARRPSVAGSRVYSGHDDHDLPHAMPTRLFKKRKRQVLPIDDLPRPLPVLLLGLAGDR
jgi:hypothetical protein